MPRLHNTAPATIDDDDLDAIDLQRAKRDTRPPVRVRVLKKGDGRIFTGEFDRESGAPEVYERGDITAPIPAASADTYEDLGYAEIVEDEPVTFADAGFEPPPEPAPEQGKGGKKAAGGE